MQLKKPSAIGASIAAATCGLLGCLPSTKVMADEAGKWQVDSALLYYGEDAGRVKDVSLNAALRRAFDEDRTLSINMSIDALTGASPSGAVPTDSVQTFTKPSGNGSYQIGAGELPLDNSFKDTRVAVAANWQQPAGESSRMAFGLGISTEYDYLHVGVDARWERDFNQRNTTLFAGLAYGKDKIDPEGGAPIALAPMQAVNDDTSKRGTDSKDVIDALIGVTQLLGRRSLLTLTYSYSKSDGYLNDPYKFLTVVDRVTGRPVAGPAGSNLALYLYEGRPETRTKQGLFAEWRYAFDRDSLALSYRIMDDDFGIASNTLEARYRWNRTAFDYLEPVVRYYQQSAADFYRTYLVQADPLPQFASADYRLADMDAVTIGAKYGRRLASQREFSVRLEYYRQTADPQGTPFGALTRSELVPSTTAVIVQFGYKFDW
jgi:hypothetical protein